MELIRMLSKTYSQCIYMVIGVWLLTSGCATMFEPPPLRIEAINLSCEEYPLLVDGDLSTKSNLKVKSPLLKQNSRNRNNTGYGDWLEGNDKAEALIQLSTLTHVAWIEVHPVSNISRLTVDTATTEIVDDKEYDFVPVKSHKIARSKNGEAIRIYIDRQVKFLKVVIYVNRDSAKVTREIFTDKIKASFDDVVIREIKVYSD